MADNVVDWSPEGQNLPPIADEKDIKFHGWGVEQKEIAKFNCDATKRILSAAGITLDNPTFKQYESLTLVNVHNFRRFGIFDEAAEKEIIEAITNCSFEEYNTITEAFKVKLANKQFEYATGPTAATANSGTYNSFIEKEKKIVKSGVKMRQEMETGFPKVFADGDRIVFDIENSASAWDEVNAYAARHNDIGLQFNGSKFTLDGKESNPGKFFNSRVKKLEKFLKNVSSLDLADKELIDCIKKGSFSEFLSIDKTRGMGHNKVNDALRQLLKNDKDLFKEVSIILTKTESNTTEFVTRLNHLSNDMQKKVELIHAETKATSLHKPKGKIDRIVFSVRPSDLARQSTFQDWKSCMSMFGKYNQYLDKTIGYGTIIAYGYDSQNPSKMISRVLIQPYKNNKGETIYRVNDTVYGEINETFNKTVSNVVEKEFNNTSCEGVFKLNNQLYADGNPETIVRLNAKENTVIDCLENGCVFNGNGQDFSRAKKIVLKDNMTIQDVISWPKNIEYGNVSRLTFSGQCTVPDSFKFPPEVILNDVQLGENGLDLRSCDKVTIANMKKLPAGIKLPENVHISAIIPDNADFSGCKNLILSSPSNLPKNVKYPKNVEVFYPQAGLDLSSIEHVHFTSFIDEEMLKSMKLPSKITIDIFPEGLDLSSFESVTISGSYISHLDNSKLPKNLVIDGNIPEGTDLSQYENLTLKNVKKLPKNVKLPPNVKTESCSAKVTMRCQAHNAKSAIKKVNIKKTLKSQAKALNSMYDRTFDKGINKIMQWEAPTFVKKLDNAVAKPIHLTERQLKIWAEDFVKTPTGAALQKKVEQSILKTCGKSALKSAAKKIPLICVGVACAMAKERFDNGEYIEGGLEVISGIAACVPVFGTAVSLGIDAAVLLSDLTKHGVPQIDLEWNENKVYGAYSTATSNPRVDAEKKREAFEKRQKEREEYKKSHKKTETYYTYKAKDMDNVPSQTDAAGVRESTQQRNNYRRPEVEAQAHTRTVEMTDTEADSGMLTEKNRKYLQQRER